MIVQMYALIALVLVAGFLFIMILIKKNDKRTKYVRWGLEVDCISFYSNRFTVPKKGLIIVGYQEVLDLQSPIQYCIVKQNWWGQTTVYGQADLCGNFIQPNHFILEYPNIPIGKDYRIKIMSPHCNLSRGKFKIMLNDNSMEFSISGLLGE